MNARERSIVERIAEAVDDHDRDLVVDLLGVLLREPRRQRRYTCPACGRTDFHWPGERDLHASRCASFDNDEAAAA